MTTPSISAGTLIFGSGLSLGDQEIQVLNFIADFTDKLANAEEEHKELISKRISRLKEDFWFLQQQRLSEQAES